MNSIKQNFGSYRGYLAHLQSLLAASLGRYDAASNIEWSRVSRLVFVCKGNVCRSPYAQARAASLGFPAASFGLDTSGDVPANPMALRVAQMRDVDLSLHRSLQFDRAHITRGDLILAFEPDHYEQLLVAAHGSDAQVSLLGIWSPARTRPYVADPYGKSQQYFQSCFAVIDASLSAVLTSLGHRQALLA